MRMLSFLLALAVAGPVTAQQPARPDSAADSGARHPKGRGHRLFESTAPLELRLRFDFHDVLRDRDTMSTKRYPAVLSYVDTAGKTISLHIDISPRGHFRLQSCGFPGLRLRFRGDSARHTMFAGQSSLKLGTHCQNRNTELEQVALREYLVYRVFNQLTDISFRVRLAHMSYVNSRDTLAQPLVKWAFLVENEDALGGRFGGTIDPQKGATFNDMDDAQSRLISVFEYFVGNTDWSLSALHNVRLLRSSTYVYYPVPYDFDWTGVVSAPYAKPDPRLGTSTVRQRIYRGTCMTPEQALQLAALFIQKKPAIYALYDSVPGLDPHYAREARDYYDEFYRSASNPTQIRRELIDGCRAAQ